MAEEEIKNKTADVAETTEDVEKAPKTKAAKGKKGKRIVNAGAVHIQATFNNTIIISFNTTDHRGIISLINGFRHIEGVVFHRAIPYSIFSSTN